MGSRVPQLEDRVKFFLVERFICLGRVVHFHSLLSVLQSADGKEVEFCRSRGNYRADDASRNGIESECRYSTEEREANCSRDFID